MSMKVEVFGSTLSCKSKDYVAFIIYIIIYLKSYQFDLCSKYDREHYFDVTQISRTLSETEMDNVTSIQMLSRDKLKH